MDDGERGMDPLLSDELVERLAPLRAAIHHPRSAVLPLVGSGLSRGLPSWVGLLERLLKRVGDVARDAIEEAYGTPRDRNAPLPEIASAIADELRIETVRTEIANVFANPSVDAPDTYDLVAALPLQQFATTNYDPWLTRAVRRRIGDVRVATPRTPDLFADTRPDVPPTVWMLHGDAGNPASCVLTKESYDELIHGNAQWYSGVGTLLRSSRLLFLGYSLADPDVRFLLAEWKHVFESAGTTHFLLAADPSPLRIRVFAKLGVEVIPYSPDDHHAELTRILRHLATTPASAKVTTSPTASPRSATSAAAAPSVPETYWKHVQASCSAVGLTGLLSHKGSSEMSVDEIYVPLLARRNDLAPRGEREPGPEIDPDGTGERGAIGALLELVEESDEKRELRDDAIAAALRAAGVPDGDAAAPRTIEETRARLLALPSDARTPERVREVLETLELDGVLRRSRNLLIEGDPGSGKTTTLKHVAMALVRARSGDDADARAMGFDDGAIPVFVPLREFWTHLRGCSEADRSRAARPRCGITSCGASRGSAAPRGSTPRSTRAAPSSCSTGSTKSSTRTCARRRRRACRRSSPSTSAAASW